MGAVATQPTIRTTSRLTRAAAAERDRLARELGRIQRRASGLRDELEALETQAAELHERIAVLQKLAGTDTEAVPTLDLVTPVPEDTRTGLRGRDIRKAAVRLLADQDQSDTPIHYTRWYRIFTDAGHAIAGQEPLATFLTQISRSPLVKKGDKPGFYLLDRSAPRRLAERIIALHRELAALHEGQESLPGFTSGRERRAQLVAEATRADRALAEVAETLQGLPE
jgi:hypothetical protein